MKKNNHKQNNKKKLTIFLLLLYTCRFFQLKSPPSFTIRTKSFERFKQNLWISLKKITIFSFFFFFLFVFFFGLVIYYKGFHNIDDYWPSEYGTFDRKSIKRCASSSRAKSSLCVLDETFTALSSLCIYHWLSPDATLAHFVIFPISPSPGASNFGPCQKLNAVRIGGKGELINVPFFFFSKCRFSWL